MNVTPSCIFSVFPSGTSNVEIIGKVKLAVISIIPLELGLK